MRKIAIIILHYKNWLDTQACLGSLKKLKKPGLKVEVIVVNNALGRKVVNQTKYTFPKVTFLTPSKNLGFAGGNNLGIKRALRDGADYILLLNNDTVVGPTLIKELLATFAQDKTTGIAGPVIKHQTNGRVFFDYGGVINWRLGKPYHINKPNHEDKQVSQRDFVTGCCLLVKREVFEKIGLLNEDYFLYLEDVEFCVRAKKAGFKILHNPQAKIFHKGSQSITEWGKIKYSWRNSLRFCWHWISWPWKLVALVHNSLFYPLLFIEWLLKRFKGFMFK